MKSLSENFKYFKEIILDESLSQQQRLKKLSAEHDSDPKVFLETIYFSFTDCCDKSLLGYAVANNNLYITSFLLSIGSFCPGIVSKKEGHISLLRREITGKNTISRLSDIIIDLKDFSGSAALNHAALKGADKVLKLLINFRVDLNMVDIRGVTPLTKSIQARHIKTVEILLEAGADSRIVDRKGDNSWHVAAKQGNKLILETMFRCDKFLAFSVTAKNSENLTPLCYKNLRQDPVFLSKLKRKLFSISLQAPQQHESFLEIAAEHENREVIEIFGGLKYQKTSPDITIYPKKPDFIHRAM